MSKSIAYDVVFEKGILMFMKWYVGELPKYKVDWGIKLITVTKIKSYKIW